MSLVPSWCAVGGKEHAHEFFFLLGDMASCLHGRRAQTTPRKNTTARGNTNRKKEILKPPWKSLFSEQTLRGLHRGQKASSVHGQDSSSLSVVGPLSIPLPCFCGLVRGCSHSPIWVTTQPPEQQTIHDRQPNRGSIIVDSHSLVIVSRCGCVSSLVLCIIVTVQYIQDSTPPSLWVLL